VPVSPVEPVEPVGPVEAVQPVELVEPAENLSLEFDVKSRIAKLCLNSQFNRKNSFQRVGGLI